MVGQLYEGKNFLMDAAITLVCLYKLWWVSIDEDGGVDTCRVGLKRIEVGMGETSWGYICVNGNKHDVEAAIL